MRNYTRDGGGDPTPCRNCGQPRAQHAAITSGTNDEYWCPDPRGGFREDHDNIGPNIFAPGERWTDTNENLSRRVTVLEQQLQRLLDVEKKSRAMTTDEWVERVVAAAPPLTSEQINKLATLLRPARDALREKRKKGTA